MGSSIKLSHKMQALIVLSAVSMSMAAPNILTHQTTSFGNGPVISHGSVHTHAAAPAVAPAFAAQPLVHGGLVGHGVAGPGLVGHGVVAPGLVGHGFARPGLAVAPAEAVQPVAGGFVHF